jgi:RNA polymerase sigma-70 factor (ECF subfamily)
MPPLPLEYQGREPVRRFFADVVFIPGRTFLMAPTRANGQPACGLYLPDPQAKIAHATGIVVVTFTGNQVSALTHFPTGLLPHFGLPRTLPCR